MRSLFVFRRDLRVEDHRALAAACRASDTVVPTFVFDPRQTDPDANDYFSPNAFQFLVEAVRDLSQSFDERGGRLYVFEGKAESVVRSLLSRGTIDAVYVSRDYTPFARKRDERLAAVADEAGATFHAEPNVLLTEPEDVTTSNGSPFFVYSPFRKAARKQSIPDPEALPRVHWETRDGSVPTTPLDAISHATNPDLAVRGRRQEALDVLDRIGDFRYYSRKRHRMDDYGQTTHLSAHLKFGTISPRELYAAVARAFGPRHKLISQLLWRDFYTHFAWHFPSVFGRAVRPKDKYLDWRDDHEAFQRWTEGRTGVPVVDAGMRELVATGYMHNRARMAVASFLSKHLLIDWRRGEQFFARHLVDYDPAVNNGNWQWSASVGLDSIPIRMFNPYTQAEKYDKGAEYVTTWVPELREADSDCLTSGDPVDLSDHDGYPPPIVDHYDAYHRATEAYETAQAEAQRHDEPRYDVSGA